MALYTSGTGQWFKERDIQVVMIHPFLIMKLKDVSNRGYVANNLNNIDVMTYSIASRIILDKTNSARGITVERFGQELQYFASRETILSAGAIGTPQVLMLSGIGPREELKKYKIRQVADLPVGKNLQDHCMVMQSVRIHNPEGSMTFGAWTLLNPLNSVEFWTNGTGPLTNNGMGVNAVMSTPKNQGRQRPGKQKGNIALKCIS